MSRIIDLTARSDVEVIDLTSEDDFEFEESVLSVLPWLETPLDPQKNAMRILKLHHSSGDEPIQCSLSVVSLDQDPYYETLSYVWGARVNLKPIIVGGTTFKATQNLWDFLRCLRLDRADRHLWAAAVCINQSDNNEKTHQSKLMRRIYRQAKQAHIWFGPFTQSWQDEISTIEHFTPTSKFTEEDWEQAYLQCEDEIWRHLKAGGKPAERTNIVTAHKDRLEDLLDRTMFMLDEMASGRCFNEIPLFSWAEDYTNSKKTYPVVLNREWAAIQDCLTWMLCNPWFSRVWTLQEAVLPKVDSVIHIGSYQVSLSRLARGFEGISKHAIRKDCCNNMGRTFQALYRGMGGMKHDAPSKIIEYQNSFKDSDDDGISLVEAIESTQFRYATEPRDHLFGIWGLLPEQITRHFAAQSYSRSVATIYAECSAWLILGHEGLRMLAEAVGVKTCAIPDLPTWAMTISVHHDQNYDSVYMERWMLHNAALDSKQDCIYNDDLHELQGPTLTLKSRLIGTIKACAPYLTENQRDSLGWESLPVVVNKWYECYKASS